jgi:hypothetical protein
MSEEENSDQEEIVFEEKKTNIYQNLLLELENDNLFSFQKNNKEPLPKDGDQKFLQNLMKDFDSKEDEEIIKIVILLFLTIGYTFRGGNRRSRRRI